MRVLVTGADGFAGRYLCRLLLASGHEVGGATRPGSNAAAGWFTDSEQASIRWRSLELESAASVAALFEADYDAVVHLAAIASGGEARRDPGHAWSVNAAGTARLLESAASAATQPLVLLVSSGEVYGRGDGARREDAPVVPVSPYAASKAAAELAAAEVARRTGLRVITARAFQHTGPGQTEQYVVPAFARRLRQARAAGQTRVPVGNLEPVRDVSDVRDVVAAYVALLERGVPGEAYNVCRGEGVSLAELFDKLSALLGLRAEAVPEPSLLRHSDLPHLVGDNTRLRSATGWASTRTLDQTLRDVINAQAD
jgi:GDP-4-dehydro-6-deoxy-D-mannose reductase